MNQQISIEDFYLFYTGLEMTYLVKGKERRVKLSKEKTMSLCVEMGIYQHRQSWADFASEDNFDGNDALNAAVILEGRRIAKRAQKELC